MDANMAARRHFARIGVRCIRDALNGVTRVNDLPAYVAWRREGIRSALRGESDHTFAHRQVRHWIEIGECVPMLG